MCVCERGPEAIYLSRERSDLPGPASGQNLYLILFATRSAGSFRIAARLYREPSEEEEARTVCLAYTDEAVCVFARGTSGARGGERGSATNY